MSKTVTDQSGEFACAAIEICYEPPVAELPASLTVEVYIAHLRPHGRGIGRVFGHRRHVMTGERIRLKDARSVATIELQLLMSLKTPASAWYFTTSKDDRECPAYGWFHKDALTGLVKSVVALWWSSSLKGRKSSESCASVRGAVRFCGLLAQAEDIETFTQHANNDASQVDKPS